MTKLRIGRVIIDTNILLLLVIGSVRNGELISKSNRLKRYTIEDYEYASRLFLSTTERYITSYVAAELSNLIDLKGENRMEVFENARLILSNMKQVDCLIKKDVENENFIKYGITDNSIIYLAQSYTIITDDHRMSGVIRKNYPNNVLNVLEYTNYSATT